MTRPRASRLLPAALAALLLAPLHHTSRSHDPPAEQAAPASPYVLALPADVLRDRAGLLARLGFAYHSVGRRALLPD